MRLICRPKGIMNPLSPAQGMKDIKAAGFDAGMLDVSAICTEQEIDNLRRNNFRRVAGVVYLTEQPERLLEETQRLLVKTAGNAGLEIDTALAPYAAPDIKLEKEQPANAERINEIYRRLGKESLKAAIAAGCKRIIVHPLFAGLDAKDEWPVNRSFYLELAETADELGSDIRILLVNRARSINGHLIRGICAEPEESCRWVDELNEAASGATTGEKSDSAGAMADTEKNAAADTTHAPRFALAFDVGTATLCGQDLYSAMAPLGERLEAVIIRDCDGIHDASLLPYAACARGPMTDWLGVFRALRGISFDGDLIMDFGDTYKAFSPMLNQHVLKLGYEVGRFFLWQCNIEKVIKKYHKRVLFGAGNMCREYLSNYGKDYPPLFTCDNNSSRWGEDFYGITIESPEKLKELSPDTAIFICNTYYREIEAQLREMNLPNPIEWFNDEYLSTFHMDRLDMAADPNAGKGAKS